MMEVFLPRLLKRSGIVYQKAGKDIEYHGISALNFMGMQSALDNMRPDLKDLHEAIHEQINQSYHGMNNML